MSESQIIHLAADLSFLHTDYLWRMPGSWVGYDYYSTSEFYEDIARIAQRGVMDMLFFGDTGGTPEDFGGNHEAVVKYGAKWPRHDMAPMIPLMAYNKFAPFDTTYWTNYPSIDNPYSASGPNWSNIRYMVVSLKAASPAAQ